MDDFFSRMDFSLSICQEKRPENGEDSSYFCYTPQGGIAAVFDGCGGSGARKYTGYREKTGAYMASRVISGAVKDWFAEVLLHLHRPGDMEPLQEKMESYMNLCRSVSGGGGSKVKGSLSREFPTTAAIVYAFPEKEGNVVHCCWAGDSRCYLLDRGGLHQLSADDLGGLDAMENLSSDGVLTNVITATDKYVLHHAAFRVTAPVMVFAATDGCFGYLSTPMEFEHLLLNTLAEADSPLNWEKKLTNHLSNIAGDDFTLNAMVIGSGGFEAWKKRMKKRTDELWTDYIQNIELLGYEDKRALWEKYKSEYEKYL